MKKRTSIYASMTASDLARITRERGLDKPDVITLSEWANFLEADDAKRQQQAQDGDRDTQDSEPEDTSPESSKPKSTKNKGS